MSLYLNKIITSKEIPYGLFVFLIFVVSMFGLSLRLSAVLNTEVQAPIRADAADYYNYALNMKYHGVYSRSPYSDEGGDIQPDARRTPGYSVFLLPFVEWPATKKMVTNITLVQAFLSAIIIALSIVLFRTFLNRSMSLLSGMFVALSPHLINANVYVLSETLFTFFLVLFLLVAVRLRPKSHWVLWILAGLVLGVACQVRPTVNYLLLFMLPLYFLFYNKKEIIKPLLLLVIGFVLVMAPWQIRNAGLVKSAHGTSLALDTIHKGMYPDLMYKGQKESYGFPNHADPAWGETNTFSKVFEEILTRFRKEPLRYLYWYAIGKPATFLSWDIIVGAGDSFIYPIYRSPYLSPGVLISTHTIMKGLHLPITALALLSFAILFTPFSYKYLSTESVHSARLIAIVVVYFIVVHTVGTPLPRYSYPIKPMLYGLGVFSAWFLFKMVVFKLRKGS